VMIEAIACGTPVIAYRRGSVPEVLEDGVTGWLVEGLEEALRAVARVPRLSRARCRQVFEARFTASRMAQAMCVSINDCWTSGQDILPQTPPGPGHLESRR